MITGQTDPKVQRSRGSRCWGVCINSQRGSTHAPHASLGEKVQRPFAAIVWRIAPRSASSPIKAHAASLGMAKTKDKEKEKERSGKSESGVSGGGDRRCSMHAFLLNPWAIMNLGKNIRRIDLSSEVFINSVNFYLIMFYILYFSRHSLKPLCPY